MTEQAQSFRSSDREATVYCVLWMCPAEYSFTHRLLWHFPEAATTNHHKYNGFTPTPCLAALEAEAGMGLEGLHGHILSVGSRESVAPHIFWFLKLTGFFFDPGPFFHFKTRTNIFQLLRPVLHSLCICLSSLTGLSPSLPLPICPYLLIGIHPWLFLRFL